MKQGYNDIEYAGYVKKKFLNCPISTKFNTTLCQGLDNVMTVRNVTTVGDSYELTARYTCVVGTLPRRISCRVSHELIQDIQFDHFVENQLQQFANNMKLQIMQDAINYINRMHYVTEHPLFGVRDDDISIKIERVS
jgi:hypothetical protein